MPALNQIWSPLGWTTASRFLCSLTSPSCLRLIDPDCRRLPTIEKITIIAKKVWFSNYMSIIFLSWKFCFETRQVIWLPQPLSQYQQVFALCPLPLKRKLAPHLDSSLHSAWYSFFQYTLHIISNSTSNHNQQALLTVSKNWIPYSSASACPIEVGTALKKKMYSKIRK